jgi:hypothetical protein
MTYYRGEDSPESRGYQRLSALAEVAMPARTDWAIRTDAIVFMAITPEAIRTTPSSTVVAGVED